MIIMNNTCKDCKHFRQHYVKINRKYTELFYGHCVYPRLKKRETTSKACQYFEDKIKKNK